MNRILYIHSGNEDEIINLYFQPNSVTLRTFILVDTLNDYEKIYRRKQKHKDRNKPSNNTEEQDDDSKIILDEYNNKVNNAISTQELVKSNKQLQGRFVRLDGHIYLVVKQSSYLVDPTCWQPYSEVCMSLMKTTRLDPEYHNIVFFDRNSQTYLGREDFSQYHKKFKISNSYIAFRWYVLPGTSLLTAPVIVDTYQKIITNLNLNSEIEIKGNGILTQEQRTIINEKIRNFKRFWIPQVVLEGPDKIHSNATVTIKVKCLHQGGELCHDTHEYEVDMISGYAPIKRVVVINGKGEFRVMALGLLKDEYLRFKINDKYWTNKAEKNIKVY